MNVRVSFPRQVHAQRVRMKAVCASSPLLLCAGSGSGPHLGRTAAQLFLSEVMMMMRFGNWSTGFWET